jgi:hypothetical protein
MSILFLPLLIGVFLEYRSIHVLQEEPKGLGCTAIMTEEIPLTLLQNEKAACLSLLFGRISTQWTGTVV